MSEEIIIDGVNVAECDFFAKEDLYNSYSGETQAYKGECGCSDDTMCKDIKNCCYKKQGKQLKRLEQENEENKRLQAENEELKAGLCKQCDFQKQYFSETKKLLAENEELKKENKENLHYLACMTEQRNKLKIENKLLKEATDNLLQVQCLCLHHQGLTEPELR